MLTHAFIISFIVLFIHATTWKGMICDWVPELMKNMPTVIRKPLFACPVCMTPWWGTIIMIMMAVKGTLVINSFSQLIHTLFAAAGITLVLSTIITAARTFASVYNDLECDCISKTERSAQRRNKLSSFDNYNA